MDWAGLGDGLNWSDPQNWNSGRVPGEKDDVDIPAGVSVRGAGGTVGTLYIGEGARLQADGLRVIERMTCEEAVLEGSIDVDGTLTINGGVLESGTLTVRGVTVWPGGSLAGGTPPGAGGQAVFNNYGDFTAGPETAMTGFGETAPVFNNAGVFRVTGTCTVTGWDFVSGGTLVVNSGTLVLGAAGSAGHGFTDGAVISGDGVVRIGQEQSAPGVEAAVGLNGKVTVSQGSVVQLAEGGVLGGSGTLAGPGKVTWIGGEMTGAVELEEAVGLEISGDEPKTLTGSLVTYGATEWTGSGPVLAVRIAAGETQLFGNYGTFTARNDAAFGASGDAAPTFVNKGSFIKSESTGTSGFYRWAFVNDHEMTVASGTVQLGGNGNSGPHQLGGSSSMSGAGRVLIGQSDPDAYGAAMAVLADDVTVGDGLTFELGEGAVLTGTGSFKGPGSLVWSDGRIAGTITVQEECTLRVEGDEVKDLCGSITNEGTVVWNGAGSGVGAGSLRNVGTFRAGTSIQAAHIGWEFVNAGYCAPPRSLALDGNFTQEESGTLRVEVAGRVSATEYTEITVAETVNLAGTLTVHLAGPFVPARGDRFTLVFAGVCTGAFDQVQGLDVPDPILSLEYTDQEVRLNAD